MELLERRICRSVMETVASISVDTLGNELDYENSILVETDEEGEHVFVFDEVCSALGCSEEGLVWGMTCIKLCVERDRLVVPEHYKSCVVVAESILRQFALPNELWCDFLQTEGAEEEGETTALAERVLALLVQEKDDPYLYSGNTLYSFPDRG